MTIDEIRKLLGVDPQELQQELSECGCDQCELILQEMENENGNK